MNEDGQRHRYQNNVVCGPLHELLLSFLQLGLENKVFHFKKLKSTFEVLLNQLKADAWSIVDIDGGEYSCEEMMDLDQEKKRKNTKKNVLDIEDSVKNSVLNHRISMDVLASLFQISKAVFSRKNHTIAKIS